MHRCTVLWLQHKAKNTNNAAAHCICVAAMPVCTCTIYFNLFGDADQFCSVLLLTTTATTGVLVPLATFYLSIPQWLLASNCLKEYHCLLIFGAYEGPQPSQNQLFSISSSDWLPAWDLVIKVYNLDDVAQENLVVFLYVSKKEMTDGIE